MFVAALNIGEGRTRRCARRRMGKGIFTYSMTVTQYSQSGPNVARSAVRPLEGPDCGRFGRRAPSSFGAPMMDVPERGAAPSGNVCARRRTNPQAWNCALLTSKNAHFPMCGMLNHRETLALLTASASPECLGGTRIAASDSRFERVERASSLRTPGESQGCPAAGGLQPFCVKRGASTPKRKCDSPTITLCSYCLAAPFTLGTLLAPVPVPAVRRLEEMQAFLGACVPFTSLSCSHGPPRGSCDTHTIT